MVPCFSVLVLHRHRAHFDRCPGCELLQARDPDWLSEAYSSPISALDTGLVARNLAVSRRLCHLLRLGMNEQGAGRYLDYAGGYGLLTRLMRDSGFDFYWTDQYCANLLAKGFEHNPSLGPCRAVTAIEVLEHVLDPVTTVSSALRSAQSDLLIATTELFAGKPPEPHDWWYYAFEGGQHISFYTRNTLAAIARRLDLQVAAVAGFFVFSRQPLDEKRLCRTLRWRAALPARLQRRGLPSKTMEDHLLLVDRLRGRTKAAT
jgi:hypothetical protein